MLNLWTQSAGVALHAACAAVYALLAGLILLRGRPSRTGGWLVAACLATAAWAGTVAIGGGGPGSASLWLEVLRGAAWYGFLLHLFRRSIVADRPLGRLFAVLGAAVVVVAMVLVSLAMAASVNASPVADGIGAVAGTPLWSFGIAAKLALAVGSLLLIENLYLNTPAEQRWNVNLLCVALGVLFLYDLILYADALLFRRVSPALFMGRASVTTLLAPLLAIAAARDRRWKVDIHVSRSVVFHSATLLASGLFLLGLAAAGEVFRRTGAEWGVVVEVTLLAAGVLLLGVLLTSGSARARARALFVDHFFSFRYDYRQEWMRCIAMLSSPDAYVGLHTRAIRAITQVVDSPAGALFVRDPEGSAFLWAGSWNMPAVTEPMSRDDPFLGRFGAGEDVVVLDSAAGAGAAPVAGLPRAWLAVPLSHLGNLIGFAVVAQSRGAFKLDREAIALLRIVGREVASHVAEQRAARVLTQERQLHEYSKRFAFVVHDIKNVSGQLSMLLANAEVHADNPEFQRDMLATVRASVARIGGMLRKMQAQASALEQTLIVPADRLPRILAARGDADDVALDHDGRASGVVMDQDAFDAVITHLLNNAREAASDPGSPVRIRLRHESASVVIEIVDGGPGMTPEFIRDELFSPFASTKAAGHGIGAFQARELLRGAGGDLLVISRRGEGATMRIVLPSAGMPTVQATELSAQHPAVSPAMRGAA